MKSKRKIIEVPDIIVKQCEIILNSKSYSSRYRKEVIRSIVGKCLKCGAVPPRFIIEKRANVEVIERYCKEYG
jgi:RNase P subunit RPR2